MVRPFRLFTPLIALLLVLTATFLARGVWLPWIAVVLAGDIAGRRIEKAARMIQASYVPAGFIPLPMTASEFHTARAGRTFRAVLPDDFSQPARKATLLEWTKPVAATLGM